MTERPILFSAPMVRALLDGSKSQTRRIIKPQPHHIYGAHAYGLPDGSAEPDGAAAGYPRIRCPHGVAGDRLWVREAWRADLAHDAIPPRDIPPGPYFCEASRAYWLGGPHDGTPGKLRPGIFMPRWASRITLEVIGVRVERLHAISDDDAIAEGIEPIPDGWRDYMDPAGLCLRPKTSYFTLWDSISGAGSWATNPWVWAVDLRRV